MTKTVWGFILVIFIIGLFSIPYLAKLDKKQEKTFSYIWCLIYFIIQAYIIVVLKI